MMAKLRGALFYFENVVFLLWLIVHYWTVHLWRHLLRFCTLAWASLVKLGSCHLGFAQNRWFIFQCCVVWWHFWESDDHIVLVILLFSSFVLVIIFFFLKINHITINKWLISLQSSSTDLSLLLYCLSSLSYVPFSSSSMCLAICRRFRLKVSSFS